MVLGENPLEDVTVFDQPEESVLGIVKDGRVCKSQWEALPEDSEIPVRVYSVDTFQGNLVIIGWKIVTSILCR